MKLTKEEKAKLFELIHDILDEQAATNAYDEYAPLTDEEYQALMESFDRKEQELIDYVNSL